MFEESMQRAILAVAIVFSITVIIAIADPRPSSSAGIVNETILRAPRAAPTVVEPDIIDEPADGPVETDVGADGVSISADAAAPIGQGPPLEQFAARIAAAGGINPLLEPLSGCVATDEILIETDMPVQYWCDPGQVVASAGGQVVLIVDEPEVADAVPSPVAEPWTWERGLSMGRIVVVDHGDRGNHSSVLSVYSGLSSVNPFLRVGGLVDIGTEVGIAEPAADHGRARLGWEVWADNSPEAQPSVTQPPPQADVALNQAQSLAAFIATPVDPICPLPLGSPNSLPNAARSYRSGTHQGVDFGCAELGHSAFSIADGRVVMVVDDFEEPITAARDAILQSAAAAGTTPHWILTMLYGNFVVVDHGNIGSAGERVVSIYAHLEEVDEGIKLGASIVRGRRIGEVGNSGTSTASEGVTAEEPGSIHLHWELFIDGHYLGKGLSDIVTDGLYETLLCQPGNDLAGCPG